MSISKKLSEVKKGSIPWNKGQSCSTETKAKISLKNKGKEAWNKGLTKDDNNSILAISKSLMGHTCFVSNWTEAKQKEYETKLQNNSFNYSQPEIDLRAQLEATYGKEDVISPYIDAERYPFNCDFYIKSEDLFIELHRTWVHGGKPYNPDDEECQKQLQLWQEKAKTSEYYAFAIYTWTDLDVRKVKIAKQNNLNFKVIY